MAYQLLLTAVLLFPGFLAHHYYQSFVSKEKFTFEVFSRVIMISVLSYLMRGLVGVYQGYGNEGLLVYFQNVDNAVKYILFSILSSFLLINAYIFLESMLKGRKKKTANQEEGNYGT